MDSGSAGQSSVIEIIQQMVKSGESEERIMATLRDLGVKPEQAKQLLLMGQTNAFALLRNEISTMVQNQMVGEKTKFGDFVQGEIEKKLVINREKIVQEIGEKYKEIGNAELFERKVMDRVARMDTENQKALKEAHDVELQLSSIRTDLEEIKIRGIGARNKAVSLALLIFGIGIVFADIFLFFSKFTIAPTVDALVITVVLALVGTAMLFASTFA